jgi:hypothetical protein
MLLVSKVLTMLVLLFSGAVAIIIATLLFLALFGRVGGSDWNKQ